MVQNPGVASIEIPLPDESERLEFIRWQVAARPLPAGLRRRLRRRSPN